MSEELAKAAAKLALQPLLSQPANVRVAAVTMAMQSVIMQDVKASMRLGFFNEWVDRVRDDLVNDLNKNHRVPDGNRDGRSDRSAGARKATRKGSKPARARRSS